MTEKLVTIVLVVFFRLGRTRKILYRLSRLSHKLFRRRRLTEKKFLATAVMAPA